MPNIKSSERSVITDALRKAQNTSVKSAVRTATRKVNEATVNAPTNAQDLLKKASSVIDKAASKGVLHKNAAARKKSRLARKVNALSK